MPTETALIADAALMHACDEVTVMVIDAAGASAPATISSAEA
ncbi:hypothetical protein OG971_23005 [Streptomyces sp. NBC_00847]|nr:hypothetical protein [Streptomyces sp. NBC_00847]MCX4882368.1 hypothetical protein [Streptomyces sp. NBC_00847]